MNAPPVSLAVVVPFTEADRLLTACDGRVAKADSLWVPPDSVLRRLEARLAQYLRERHSAALEDYSRQYLGLYRADREIVFVNGVHQLYMQRLLERNFGRAEALSHWFRSHAVGVCDGGTGFFRAEYHLGSGRIAEFTFNEYEGGDR